MKVQKHDTTVLSSGTERSQMAMVSNAQAFRVLSDTIYEYKILAVVRELSSNANDSHTEAGVTRPFRYRLPNTITSTFAVEDFGIGLDDEGVRRVMFSYFQSTKDDDDSATGCLGLGSKSPLAYTDAFTITARKDGMERVYTSYWGEGGVPELTRVHMRPTSEPNGVKIELPVQTEDQREFINAASFMACMFTVTPEFTGGQPDGGIMEEFGNFAAKAAEGNLFTVQGNQYGVPALYRQSDIWVSMGSVVYPTDASEVIEVLDKDTRRMIQTSFGSSGRTLVVPVGMGTVDFSASREKLSLTPRTKATVKDAVKDLIDEMVAVGTDVMRSDYSPTENALVAQAAILKKSGLSVNDEKHVSWLRKVPVDMGDGTESTVWGVLNNNIPENHGRFLMRHGLAIFRIGRRGTFSDGALQMRCNELGMHYSKHWIDPDDPSRGVYRRAYSRDHIHPRMLFNSEQSHVWRSLPNRDQLLDKKIPVFYASDELTGSRKIIRDRLINEVLDTQKGASMRVNGLGAIAFMHRCMDEKTLKRIKNVLGENLFEYHDISAIHTEQKERRKQERKARAAKNPAAEHKNTVRGDADKVRTPWFPITIENHHTRGTKVGINQIQTSSVIDTGDMDTFYINPYDESVEGSMSAAILIAARSGGIRSASGGIPREISSAMRATFRMSPNKGGDASGALVIATRSTLKRLQNSKAKDITSLVTLPKDVVRAMRVSKDLPRRVVYQPCVADVTGRHSYHEHVKEDAVAAFMEMKRDVIELACPELSGVAFSGHEDGSHYSFSAAREPFYHNVHPSMMERWRSDRRHEFISELIKREYPLLGPALTSKTYLNPATVASYVEMVDKAKAEAHNDENTKGEA